MGRCTILAELCNMPSILKKKKRLKKNLTKKQLQQQDKTFHSTETAPPTDGSLLLHRKRMQAKAKRASGSAP
jgi:hypothetical protein